MSLLKSIVRGVKNARLAFSAILGNSQTRFEYSTSGLVISKMERMANLASEVAHFDTPIESTTNVKFSDLIANAQVNC